MTDTPTINKPLSAEKTATLIQALKALESKILFHASHNQTETVESFLSVIVRKAKLEGEITLVANWNCDELKATKNVTADNLDAYLEEPLQKKIQIVISAQNELINMQYVEQLFDLFIQTKFDHCTFIKYIEFNGNLSGYNDLSITVKTETGVGVLAADKLRFHVARFCSHGDPRTIKIVVYVNEIIDHLLKPTTSGDRWIPDPCLFYMMDLIFGEYYMTKHISTINFAPLIIMDEKTEFLSITEAKEHIDDLLRIKHTRCAKCKFPEYRVKITQTSAGTNLCHLCA